MVSIVKILDKYNQSKIKEYLLDSPEALADLPTSTDKKSQHDVASPGSVAYTADLNHIWILNNNNQWVEA